MSDAAEEARLDFPEEVLIEILSWLPVKSLIRFRCVSRTWLHWLSSDSRFIELHLERSKRKDPGVIVSCIKGLERTQLYCVEDCTPYVEAIPFQIPFSSPHYRTYLGGFFSDDFRVVSVCNGLICITDFHSTNDSNVYVWNPLTRDHIIIPVPSFPSHVDGHMDNGVAVIYGFGFHQGSNEYKVVRIISIDVLYGPEFTSNVSVYTLGTDSWRNLGDIMDYKISIFHSDSALVNGSLHWFLMRARVDFIEYVLVSFDLQSELFGEIPQPQYIKIDCGANEMDFVRYCVGELRGLLCIFRGVFHTQMEIWMMKEYGVVDSWSKQFTIKGCKIPLGVANNEEIVLVENEDDHQLILYNPKTNSTKRLNHFSFPVYDTINYSGSLLSPTIINRRKHSSA